MICFETWPGKFELTEISCIIFTQPFIKNIRYVQCLQCCNKETKNQGGWHLSISSLDISSLTVYPKFFTLFISSLQIHPFFFIFSILSLQIHPNLFHPVNFIFTNSSPFFYPTQHHPFYFICYISYPLNSYSSKLDLLFHPFNLILTISSSSNHSLYLIFLI